MMDETKETLDADVTFSSDLEDEDLAEIMDEAMDAAAQATEQAVREIFRKHGRSLAKASRRQKKELYDSEKIVGKTFNSEAKTIGDKLADEYRTLAQAMNANPKINLTGTIVGCEEMPNLKTVCAIVQLSGSEGYYKIIIPVSRLFCYDVTSLNQDVNELQRSVFNRIGSTIKFQVVNVQEKEKVAFASRLDAMQSESRANYIKKQSDGKPRIVKDNIVEATITSTRRNGIYVEAFGAECYIKGEALGWNHVIEANETFKIGQKVNVKLLSVTPEDYFSPDKTPYKLVKIDASIREATKDPREMYYDQFAMGQNYVAVVTEVNENHVFVSLGPNKMDAICFIPQFGIPSRGNQVIVQIIDKNDEQKRIGAIIKRIL